MSHSKMDLAHREAVAGSVPDIAGELQRLLGQKLVAFAVGVRSPRLVGRWAAGTVTPNQDTQRRLRELFRVYRVLALELGDESAAAWLSGMNPDLDDEVPLAVLHGDEGRGREVLRAAAAFVEADVPLPTAVAA